MRKISLLYFITRAIDAAALMPAADIIIASHRKRRHAECDFFEDESIRSKFHYFTMTNIISLIARLNNFAYGCCAGHISQPR